MALSSGSSSVMAGKLRAMVAYEDGAMTWQMVVSLNYCSQNRGNVYRASYYNGNPNIGPRIIGNLDQSPNEPSPIASASAIAIASTIIFYNYY